MTDSKEVFPEAGRELDALVAEKVMGIAPRRVRVHGTTDVVTIYTDNAYFSGDAIRESDIWHVEAKPYSTDIRAAWEVVEKLQPNLYLELYVEKHLGEQIATARFIGDRWRDPSQHFEADTKSGAAHAICLAALEACFVSTTAETPK